MSTEIEIEGRPIGAGHPVYVIAELSANHQHDLNTAIELVRAARAAGADAVKVQTYTADTITIDSEKSISGSAMARSGNTKSGRSRLRRINAMGVAAETPSYRA